MSVISFARAAQAAAFVGALVLVSGATPARADCKGHFHSATGTSKIETFAGIAARRAWRARVREHDGSGYTWWSKAEDKTEKCEKSGPGGTWVCTSRARPCK